jgi:hypothetical protein
MTLIESQVFLSPRVSRNESSETALVVCRDVEGVPWLRNDLPRTGHSLVVASDDLRVHAEARKIEGVQDVVFLEKVESFYAVAPDVLEILRAVNEWLSRLDHEDGIPRDLLYWVCHCEGGDTTQRIQDALLLVRSYLGLIERLRPSEIVVVRNMSSSWEDDLLVACSARAGLHVRFVGNLGWRGRASRLWTQWRPLLKEIYFSLSIIRAWFRNAGRSRPPLDPQRLVAVQLCSAAKKHFNYCAPLIASLDRSGFQGVALCWGAGGAVNALRQEKRRAIELEAWVGLRVLLTSWRRTANSWSRVRANREDFLKNETGCIHSELLRSVLWSSMRSFFLGEVAHRYRLDSACRNFFAKNPPRAARLWTRVLPQGVTAYRALPPGRRPLLFWQPSDSFYTIPWPYEHYDVPVDLVFVISEEHRNALLRKGLSPDRIVIAGFPWLTNLQSFQKRYGKSESRNIVGVKGEPDLCLLLDPGYVIRGYMAPAEQSLILSTILEVTRDFPNMHLIIKPHPGHLPGMLEALLSKYSLGNVTEVPKDDLPYHALNAADILITKMSMLAVEGMVLGVPTLAVLLDGERRFACFEDAAEYFFGVSDLRARVAELAGNPGLREGWKRKMRANATGYLRRHSSDLMQDPNEIIAHALQERLRCLN